MKNMPVLSDDEFEKFQKMLIEESGLFFDKDKIMSLSSAIYERINERKCNSYIEYYNLLESHSDGNYEFQKLYNLITVGETYFFRTTPHFDALANYVLPDIIKRKRFTKNRSIRVWSSGCSKGDEAYSIALAILKAIPAFDEWDISILGTDINRNVINQAIAGVYTKKDVSNIPDEYLGKYFVSDGKDYLLDEKIKKLVKFKYHNLVKDPFIMEEMQDLDIIFCRNVTIYFNPDTIKFVVEKFYDCLTDDGSLIIGSSETLWNITDKFSIVEFPDTFIYKKTKIGEGKEEIAPFLGMPEVEFVEYPEIIQDKKEIFSWKNEDINDTKDNKTDDLNKGSVSIDDNYKTALKYFKDRKYSEALYLLEIIISENKKNVNAYYLKAAIFANQAKYDEAVNELRILIDINNLFLKGYYLLGVLMYKKGDFNKAEEQFKKVIYLNPEVIIAYYNLGNIYLYKNNYTRAEREFKNALKILRKIDPDEKIKFCEDFTADFLIRACKNKLTGINDICRND